MTDSPESPEIEEVRRLLADARHAEPMPDDVAARMDDVIAGLRETPVATPAVPADADRGGPVVSLAAHRRRRAAGLLVAAAAIVVGGVVVAQHLPQSSSDSESASAASGAEDSTQSRSTPAPQNLAGDSARNGSTAPKAVLKGGRLVVHPRRFSADALAGQRLLQRNTAKDSLALGTVSCAAVPTSAGRVLKATYQRAPAALVYRAASGGSQVVDLFVCGTRRPIRTATLPAP